MTVNHGYHQLANEVDYYLSLLQLLKIQKHINGGYGWSLGSGGREREIQIDLSGNTKERQIRPKELAIIAIAFSQGNDDTPEKRIQSQSELMSLGIVSLDNIVDLAHNLTKNTKRDHFTKDHFIVNATENAAKICILIRAYEKIALHLSENNEDLNDPEYMILLGYIIAVLGYTYQFRPYMINHNLINVDWVMIYDSMFDSFSEESRQRYADSGYLALWEVFHSIRNEIAVKKHLKREVLKAQVFQDKIGIYVTDLLKGILTRSRPSA